ncbi:MAG: metal ABC transporter permease [candidate division WS1 bacterium]|jgi:zinc transport system permease protein|nr:metal ABC transporter permease [candidate division WS1 bacterium]
MVVEAAVSDFLRAVGEHAFLQYALAAGLLASVACGVVGSWVSARRITYIAGGIAHSVLGGLGAARYLQTVMEWEWLHPLYGAVVAALLAALVIGFVSLRWRESEDTAISAIWAIGMAVGVLFIARTPGYAEDLMSYLFGNILMVTPGSLWLIAALDLVVVALGIIFYQQLLAISFDEEFARMRGINVEAFYLLLLCMVALTVVLLVTVVGLVMVIALLTLPIAIAGRLSRSIAQTMVLAAIIIALLTTVGLGVSYSANLPAGATIILLTGALYLITLVGASFFRRVGRSRGGQASQQQPPR